MESDGRGSFMVRRAIMLVVASWARCNCYHSLDHKVALFIRLLL